MDKSGPAFPYWNQIGESGTPYPEGPGMSLREWYAGLAMGAISVDLSTPLSPCWLDANQRRIAIVRHAREMAERMIRELNKEPTDG